MQVNAKLNDQFQEFMNSIKSGCIVYNHQFNDQPIRKKTAVFQ